MKKRANDYLKYWRVIRKYYQMKYELSTSDLDILLFLYSEEYFYKSKFDEFNKLFSWSSWRFQSLRSRNFIEVFRRGGQSRRVIYKLSMKATRIVTDIYNKLDGDEIARSTNPLNKKRTSSVEKSYQDMIQKMNEATRQQQRQSLE